ncbi:protein translocase subunit SecF [Candidatus Actinomarina sp.]|jgi:preprotein translocase subunit SecF|nr:protein translocase subunit SecF [Acidimicrobiia bacterium]MDA8652629.1 protein translocase subunit SecF [Candidatus Actinomarina sp.]MDA8667918.1 protein translocase subunit SecF [Candidatus Actinomarina sp.]MDA8710378.1 protein translocase subunit SecF [Candidatus Actinomarina sp.]MDA8812925.1 protein translocase subunit SecF [Candidatus Actinomarina sp.]
MIKKLFIGSTDIDFLKVGKLFYRIFIIEAVIFIAVFIFSLTGILNVNLSVDFTGGTTYQFEANYDGTDIDDVMASTILDVSRYQTFENSNSLIFRATENTQDKETEFLFYLSNKFDIPDADIDFQRVGPTFGDEITTKGIQALIIFLTLVVLLISYRYEFKYSLIALIALTHDLLLVFSIYVLLGLEITPSTVIALLTILGYSLYDTVILFDKLNDSIKSSKYSYLSEGSLNKTFNEVLMRSLNTSITSAIPIASILFLGNYLGLSGTLSDFALPLFIGILSGTYSSIFVTVPFLAKIINK